MELTGRQIRQLRSMANRLEATIGVGKAGKLVKCSVQGTSGMDTREAAIALARPTHAEVVQVIGHKFVLYRTSQREDIEHIQLV